MQNDNEYVEITCIHVPILFLHVLLIIIIVHKGTCIVFPFKMRKLPLLCVGGILSMYTGGGGGEEKVRK